MTGNMLSITWVKMLPTAWKDRQNVISEVSTVQGKCSCKHFSFLFRCYVIDRPVLHLDGKNKSQFSSMNEWSVHIHIQCCLDKALSFFYSKLTRILHQQVLSGILDVKLELIILLISLWTFTKVLCLYELHFVYILFVSLTQAFTRHVHIPGIL